MKGTRYHSLVTLGNGRKTPYHVPICTCVELEDDGICGCHGGAVGADAMVTRGNLSGMRRG